VDTGIEIAMTFRQAAQLAEVLRAWSEGAQVETRSGSLPGEPWKPFTPGEGGWIPIMLYQEWRVAALPPVPRRISAWRRFFSG